MWETYNDRSLNDIKNDVRNEFKNIDSFWTRDDQEIYTSWLNIIKRYRDQVLSSDKLKKKERYIIWKDGKPVIFRTWNEYRKAAKKYFTEAYNKIVDLHNNVKWWIKFTTDAEDEKIITDVAKKIDKAENDALQKIADYCNPMQEWDNASYHSSVAKDKQWNVKVKNWEIERQKPLFVQSKDWTITFTDRTNPLKIHQALGDLFKNKDKVYKIDYSKCKNQNIKAKIQNLVWWLSCWIKYDKKSQTYVLTDKTWRILSDRALVWDWVTIKQDTIIESQERDNEWERMSNEERNSLENLRSTSEPFEFDANNYKYYEELRKSTGKNICATYAYWVVSDILAKKWCCFPAQEVDAWKISWQSSTANHFNINKLDDDNPQQQIVNAPAGTFLTMRFDGSHATASWVSHVMVSIWNWVYTDLFGTNIRKIDFKSGTNFSWKKFIYWWQSYTLTEDSRLMSPKFSSFSDWSEQTVDAENLSPNEFANQIYKSTWTNINYIKSLIAKQNNIPLWKFWEKVDNISVKIISKEINDLKLENREWSNDVANQFLETLKNYKRDLMNHYPNITNHEYDEIAKRAMWILYQESDAWDSTKYWGVLWVGWKEWSVPLYWIAISLVKAFTWEERSRWYTQIKYNQLFDENDKQYLKTFWINKWSDLTNVEKCWIATMVWLIGNYNRTIIPMKKDPFWKNDAEIIEIKFNDWERESIAKWKALNINWTRRPRTEAEIQEKIKEWWDKHWWIAEQNTVIRPWIRDDEFFDFLYYSWNRPSEIYYWTATPKEKGSIAQHYNQHMDNLA